MNYQKGVNFKKGNQILHYRSYNTPYWENSESQKMADCYFQHAKQLCSDAEVLKFASDHLTIDGLFLELGVCTGMTINFIAALNPHHTIYGFDSFEGLPEDWVCGKRIIPKGSLGLKNPSQPPPVLHNVELIKGWFEDSLPQFVTRAPQDQSIAFLHVDCDLYSSTACAFKHLAALIKAGTIIVFDEFYNYPGYENHEFKAFHEFLESSAFKPEFLGYNIYHQQVAVRILDS
ncbi:MAG TPA: hypothetical protein DCY86_13775 [Bdellovibrionales bacterium]|nr:hypothetical protein [Bdellovibrionales bacterium]